MLPTNLSIRQRGVERDNIEGRQSQRALDNVPIRNYYSSGRHTATSSTARPAPSSARKKVELPQTLSYPELPIEAYTHDADFVNNKPSLRPSASQPKYLDDPVTASWDLDAAETFALSQPEPPSLANESDADDDSCSPTPSEIDALEESFYKFELQSSQPETETMQSSSSDLITSTVSAPLSIGADSSQKGFQKASSANYNNHSRTSSLTPTLVALPPCLTDNHETRTSKAIKDRLHLVWRMS